MNLLVQIFFLFLLRYYPKQFLHITEMKFTTNQEQQTMMEDRHCVCV